MILLLSSILIFVYTCIEEVKDIDVRLYGKNASVCRIYDADGNETESTDAISNTYVPIEDIPKTTIDAFLSIEDKEFYNHDGVNYKRIFSSALNNLMSFSFSQGGSTITQQLVKNKFLTNEKTLSRKVKEIYLSKKLETVESKDSIIEEYLNSIYYGSGAYGIGNASMRYFGKNVKDLTLDESCVIAGVINSPSKYSPIANIENCKKRRNLILKEMYEDGKISKDEYEENINKDIKLDVHSIINLRALDLYTQNVLNEASKILNISKEEILRGDYKINTYQNPSIQSSLDNTIHNDTYYQKNDYGNIADSLGIILDNKTGGVVAVSGKSEYNLIDIKRQPGSLVKPVLVYAPAMEEKIIYPCSELYDERITIDGYSPHNVGDKYYGYCSIDDCLGKSLNTPTIKLCSELGIEKCKEYGERAGLEFSNDDTGLAISLGGLTNGFTIQSIADSYLPLSNNGMYKNSRYIKSIVSPRRITLYTDNMSETKYCSTDTAYFMTKSLINSTKSGTSKLLKNLPYEVAGKTGTVNVKNSNLNTDCYSLAFTTEHTMCVWLGNYTMEKEFNLLGNNNGGTYATQMVRDTFEDIYSLSPPPNFTKPNTIVSLPIDTISLEENHEIILAENLPSRYQKLEEFSIDNIPPTSGKSIATNNIDFDLTNNNSSVEISIPTSKYFHYSIYQIDTNGNKKLVNTISNNCGIYKYIDSNILFNKEYQYYILASHLNGNKVKSDTKSITIPKDYSSYLNTQDNISWLFA